MLPLLLLLFVVVPIAELAVIIQVGQAIGVLPTIAILVADSVLGSVLMRAQGRASWRRLTAALSAGRAPAREAIDGALVIFGGALLLTPGFLTDILGLLLLLPPTRAVFRRVLTRRFAARMLRSMAARGRMGGGAGRPPGGSAPSDVDGTAVDLDPGRLDRPR
jgi:UPF0716 protein FxsA